MDDTRKRRNLQVKTEVRVFLRHLSHLSFRAEKKDNKRRAIYFTWKNSELCRLRICSVCSCSVDSAHTVQFLLTTVERLGAWNIMARRATIPLGRAQKFKKKILLDLWLLVKHAAVSIKIVEQVLCHSGLLKQTSFSSLETSLPRGSFSGDPATSGTWILGSRGVISWCDKVGLELIKNRLCCVCCLFFHSAPISNFCLET